MLCVCVKKDLEVEYMIDFILTMLCVDYGLDKHFIDLVHCVLQPNYINYVCYADV